MHSRFHIGLFAGCAILCAPHAAAQSQSQSWYSTQFKVGAGVEHDSNVGVPDLDQNTGSSDEALVLELDGKLELLPLDNLTLRAGYNFDLTQYSSFDEFSLQTHLATLEGDYDFGVLKAGLLYNAAHARLDGDAYLDYQQISPNISRLFGETLYVRAAYLNIEKDFETANGRDADGQGGQIDAFFFLNGTRRYIVLGAKQVEEDAANDEFDLTETGLKARFIQRLELLSREASFRIGVEAENKDYDIATQSIGEVRSDDLIKGEARAEIRIVEPIALDIGYVYTDRSSNLSSADYDEHVATARLVAKF